MANSFAHFDKIKAPRVMAPYSSANRSLQSLLGLTPQMVLALPPDWRDKLLNYLLVWGNPQELLDVIAALRQAHGAPLYLFDLEAQGLAKLGQYAGALQVIERRLRRGSPLGTALAALAFEAATLQAAGHTAHALDAGQELLHAYPRNVTAVTAAAAILSAHGQFPRACELLETLLERHPGNPRILLTLAQLALDEHEQTLADQYLQRLGIGVPADIGDEDLLQLASLQRALNFAESARTVEIELERRRRDQISALRTLLDPLLKLPPGSPLGPIENAENAYRLLSGPESISVSDGERRKIILEAVRYFGFTELREGQAETVATVLRGESILVVMPTGAGKSLCYQLPALMQPGTTLVISPLIALMKDQVENLPAAERRKATFINSTLSDQELQKRMRGVTAGRYKLIYAAPERLRHLAFLRSIRQTGLALFVVDEAHCVSLWGHDFRPDYLFLQTARAELGNPSALAMTATAPPRVRDEIVDYISDSGSTSVIANSFAYAAGSATPEPVRGNRPRVLALDIFRNNLHLSALQIHSEEEKVHAATKFTAETTGSGIIYVNSRRKSESLAYALRQAGVKAEAYHAGLENRGEIQDRFMSDATRVIVATIAFGMGIDKPDIRFIVHFHPPRSLASYYQEVGRAGRDGKPSQGILFYSNNDWSNLRRWARSDEYTVDFLEKVYMAVASQLGATPDNGSTPSSRHHEMDNTASTAAEIAGPVDPRRIQQVLNTDQTSVRVAVSLLERVDLLDRGFDFPEKVEIKLPDHPPPEAPSDRELQRLLRGLGLQWGQQAAFRLVDIASFMKWSAHQAEPKLLDLEQRGLLTPHFERRTMLIQLSPPSNDVRERLERVLAQSAAVSQRRIDDVIGYATAATCRHGYISAHLGSRPVSHCSVCDNCTGIRPDLPAPEILPEINLANADIAAMIVDCLISLPKAVGRSGLARVLAGSLRTPASPEDARHFGRLRALGTESIVQTIDELIRENLLRQYDRNGYPVLSATLKGRNEAQSWREDHPDLAHYGAPQAVDPDGASPGAVPSDKPRYTKLQTAIWSWRRRMAEQQNQPVYMIMDNDVILRIAKARPQTLDELAAIAGIGTQRLERYGPVLLDLVRLHPPEEGDDRLIAQQRSATPEPVRGNPLREEREQSVRPAPVSAQVERFIYLRLQEIRQRGAVREACSPYAIASNRLLKAIAAAAPQTTAQLDQIPGFRSSGLKDLAEQICRLALDARNTASPAP